MQSKNNQQKMVLNPTDLLDQILVHCPNTEYCNQILPRCDLTSHIMEWCQGILNHCPYREFGCNFLGPRFQIIVHKTECKFKDTTELFLYKEECETEIDIHEKPKELNDKEQCKIQYPVPINSRKINEGHITVIELEHDLEEDLGISIVGGIDTPLRNIYIQDVMKHSVASNDGRLRSGDQIIEINHCNLCFMRHNQVVETVRSITKNACSVVLSIFRDYNRDRSKTITTHLRRENNSILGLQMGGFENRDGVFILDIIENSEAFLNGKLRRNDQIMQINDIIVGDKTQEEVSQIINSSIGTVKIVVSRKEDCSTDAINKLSSSDDDLKSDLIFKNLDSNFIASRQSPVIREKLVSISKKPGQYLGLTVAGGLGFNGGDSPIYIANIVDCSVMRYHPGVEKGDVILSVNNIDLLGIQHSEAVASLKYVCDTYEKVDIRLLKCSELFSEKYPGDFRPNWLYWLNLPNYCQFPKTFYVTKDEKNSPIGFSIVGGFDFPTSDTKQVSPGAGPIGVIAQSKFHNNYDIYVIVKSVVPHSPAAKSGQIKCGDIVLAVGDTSVNHISHEEIVKLLRKPNKKVKLKVLSVSGSIV